MSGNLLGALLMMASMFSFTVNDSFVKLIGNDLPLPQLLAVRGLVASALMIGLGLWLGGLRLRLDRHSWRAIMLRSLCEIGAAYFFLTALRNMPIANVTAVLQALPLTVTLGAFLVFREPVGWRRIMAIFAGFLGMLLILRPGPEGFSIWSAYALVAVLCVTARDLVTRRLPAEVPSLTVATANSILVAAFFAMVSAAGPWAPIEAETGWLLLGSAIFIVGGYFFSVQTMRVGEISFVAPFRYTSLLWALLLGLVIFGEWPTPLTLMGAGIVVAAGLFTFWREQRVTRRGS